MTTLIIGAGLIGSHVARSLVERGEAPVLMDIRAQRGALAQLFDLERVRIIEGSVLDPPALYDVIERYSISGIVHLAVNPMLTAGAQVDPRAAVELNIMGSVNVLEAARKLGHCRTVLASSTVLSNFMAGGEGGGDRTQEEAYPRPTTFYAACKQAVENLALNYARWHDVDVVALRIGAVAGPWNGHGGGRPSNWFREAVQAALIGDTVVIPPARMDWVYVRDVASSVLAALDTRHLRNRIYNIAMGRLVDGRDLKAAIEAVFPSAVVRIERPTRQAGVAVPDMERASDITLARCQLNFAPRFGMVEAVADMASWLKAQTHVPG